MSEIGNILKKLKGKKSTAEIVEKIQSGAIHFSPEQGLDGFQKMTQKEALKELRAKGIEALPSGGMYNGKKEGSIFIPNPSEDAKKIVSDMAKKTGQESILSVKPGKIAESSLDYISGPKANTSETLPKGFKISSKQPTGENWTKVSTKEGPRYIEYGSETMPATHYGKSELEKVDMLDPQHAGTSVDERKFMRTGKPETKTIHHYEYGQKPEDQVLSAGTEKYTSNVPIKQYDFSKDPENFMEKAQKNFREGNYTGQPINPTDLAKKYAKEAGYDAINWKMDNDRNIVETFSPTSHVLGAKIAAQIASGKQQKPQVDVNDKTEMRQYIDQAMRGENPELEKMVAGKVSDVKDSGIVDKVVSGLSAAKNSKAVDYMLNAEPGLGMPTLNQLGKAASTTLDVLGMPQQALQKGANYVTGNPIDVQSFEPAIRTTLGGILPESGVKGLSMALDFEGDPLGAMGSIGKVGKEIKVADVANRMAEIEHAGLAMKKPNAAQIVEQSQVTKKVPVVPTAQEVNEIGQAEKMKQGGNKYKEMLDEKLNKLRSEKVNQSVMKMPKPELVEKSGFDLWSEQNPGATKADYIKTMVPVKQ